MKKSVKKEIPKTYDKEDMKARVAFASYIATHLQHQINFADTKAAWTFSVLAVASGALISKLTKVNWSSVDVARTTILFSISAIAIILAFLQIVRVIYPRLVKGHKEGMSYFGDIIENNPHEYVKKGEMLSGTKTISELYEESYNLARIASEKFRHLHYGIIMTSIALIITIIILLIV